MTPIFSMMKIVFMCALGAAACIVYILVYAVCSTIYSFRNRCTLCRGETWKLKDYDGIWVRRCKECRHDTLSGPKGWLDPL